MSSAAPWCSGSRRTVLFRLSDTDTVYGCNAWYQGVHSRSIRRNRFHSGSIDRRVLHGLFHPDGERFNFAWEWLPVSGLSVKDFIAPSSFRFGDGRMFQMGGKFGAVSFLQIAAPELSDRMLADFMEAENGIVAALWRAEKVQKKAKKAGFDWPDVSGALDKLSEELNDVLIPAVM